MNPIVDAISRHAIRDMLLSESIYSLVTYGKEPCVQLYPQRCLVERLEQLFDDHTRCYVLDANYTLPAKRNCRNRTRAAFWARVLSYHQWRFAYRSRIYAIARVRDQGHACEYAHKPTNASMTLRSVIEALIDTMKTIKVRGWHVSAITYESGDGAFLSNERAEQIVRMHHTPYGIAYSRRRTHLYDSALLDDVSQVDAYYYHITCRDTTWGSSYTNTIHIARTT